MIKVKKLFLCAGSESEGDSLAFEIKDILESRLKNHRFCDCRDSTEMAGYLRKNIEVVIIDVVKGLKKTQLFDGADAFAKTHSATAHDLDAGTMLKIFEAAAGRKYRIIGVPFGHEKTKAALEVEKIISSLG
ncbi:MAG: hypothetical protein NTU57_01755 [Candidatus Aenigmarchaeota archaeon]|nr:hypothetical protein [Candidatus Aenigmarchaeota archaeon]